MTVGFGFSVTPGEPLGVGAEMRRAEALGYDRFGVWDSPALFREPWVTLASAARDTERIRLGTWVTNPLSRHPLVTAACAATVDDLAPGRVYIGIGAGGTGVWHLGLGTAVPVGERLGFGPFPPDALARRVEDPRELEAVPVGFRSLSHPPPDSSRFAAARPSGRSPRPRTGGRARATPRHA